MEDWFALSSFILPLVVAITLHEAAHGFVADKLGDSTARLMGRVTFDPIKHIDVFGTLILPALLLFSGAPMLFGYAKPVPVNFNRLNNPRIGSLLVAAAGPGMNLMLALLSALLLHIEVFVTPEQAPWMFMNLYNSVTVNVILAVFNMLPILPLDGGRVLHSLLPPQLARTYAQTERHGMAIVLILFLLPAFLQQMHMPAPDIAHYLISVPADIMRDWVFALAGIGQDAN